MKELGLFAAGVLFGTAGIKLLSSKDAKKGLCPHHCRRPACQGGCDENGHRRAGGRG